MIRWGIKRGSRLAGFVERAALGSGKVFPLLLLELHRVGDVEQASFCLRDKLLQHRSLGRACSVLAPCHASASDAETLTDTAYWSSSVTALFFAQRLFRLNGPFPRRGRVALRRRGRSGEV